VHISKQTLISEHVQQVWSICFIYTLTLHVFFICFFILLFK